MLQSLSEASYAVKHVLKELETIKFEDIESFICSLGSRMFIDIESFGDIKIEDAIEILEVFQGFEALTNKPKGYGVKHIDYGTVGIKVNAHITRHKVCFQIGETPHANETAVLLLHN
ncbi:hypothetical protein DY000_02059391 [Brassica cretica]|uniref:Uncharacterized protein n=1 Tax=Brassica cretica TaxID=69181 RepID=A0ABQ7B317_BRACR|nr:hypothetical protein DY000_02059391 [Brassica cretica]